MPATKISPISLRLAMLATVASVAVTAVPASAETTATAMTVGATVTKNCILATTPINLGDIDTTSTAARDQTGSISVTCTNGAGWSAAADAGQTVGATPGTRRMVNGTDVLDYALYSDATRTILWGDGTAGTTPITDTGNGIAQDKIIYASVLPGQVAAHAGAYTDQISVTVTY